MPRYLPPRPRRLVTLSDSVRPSPFLPQRQGAVSPSCPPALFRWLTRRTVTWQALPTCRDRVCGGDVSLSGHPCGEGSPMHDALRALTNIGKTSAQVLHALSIHTTE